MFFEGRLGMRKKYLSLVFIVFIISVSYSQDVFKLPDNKNTDKIRFQLINNLIVIPVEVNGNELSFLLDTGISKTIIFNSKNLRKTVETGDSERALLRGLGEGGTIESLRSRNNIVKIGSAVNKNQDLFAVFDDRLNFTPRLGIPIHGIIGYDFLKDFVTEINYSSKFLKLNTHEAYIPNTCNTCEVFDLTIHQNKPYVNGQIRSNNNEIPVMLLIDSGGSDALWLFNNNQIKFPSDYFDDFLGFGLSGGIYGKRSRIQGFSLGNFKLSNVNVAYPNSTSIDNGKIVKGRNGSMSGEILKRFNIVLDLKNKKIALKKNRYFSNAFSYNKSGITIEQIEVERVIDNDVYFGEYGKKTVNKVTVDVSGGTKSYIGPAFVIVEIRPESPAYQAGLKFGDILVSINGKSAANYSLQDLNNLFYDREGKRVSLVINRNGRKRNISFLLQDVFK